MGLGEVAGRGKVARRVGCVLEHAPYVCANAKGRTHGAPFASLVGWQDYSCWPRNISRNWNMFRKLI
jgi:hypothetical protein